MIETNWLKWDDARPIVSHFFNFWPDGEDIIWAKHCWSALDKSGLNIYQNDKEEMICRENVGLLALFYNEACWRFQDYIADTDSCFSSLDEEEQIELFGGSNPSQINKALEKIHESLLMEIGSESLFDYTLASIISGSSRGLTPNNMNSEIKKRSDPHPAASPDDPNANNLQKFLFYGEMDVQSFECLCVPTSYLEEVNF